MNSYRFHKVINITFIMVVLLLIKDLSAQPKNPVIFIHGLFSDSDVWKPFGDVLVSHGWKFGGCPQLNGDSDIRSACDTPLQAGNFYRMQFSSNQDLPFATQAEELRDVIDRVLSINLQNNIILIAHSMGGLAARSYLQFLGPIHRVEKLITIGTPHLGSRLAMIAQDSCDTTELTLICRAADIFFNREVFSVSVTELRPDSLALETLNNIDMNPLPSDVMYTSLIGIGTSVIGENGQDGDGVVTISSQNLVSITGDLSLIHTAIPIPIEDRPQCNPLSAIPTVDITHACEADDAGVWAEILRQLRPAPVACHTIEFPDLHEDPEFAAPYNVFTGELLIRAECDGSGTARITLGNGTDASRVWPVGHQWVAETEEFIERQLQCDRLNDSGYCIGQATTNIPLGLNSVANLDWFIGYLCYDNNGDSKCGCRDQQCQESIWSIQGIQPQTEIQNRPPEPTAPEIVTTTGTTGTSQINVNDPDIGQSHQYLLSSFPSHGVASISEDGVVSYTPNTGYVGSDRLVVTVTDNGSPPLSANVEIIIHVNPVGVHLIAIEVHPLREYETPFVMLLGERVGLTATSIFSDGSTGTVTNRAEWTVTSNEAGFLDHSYYFRANNIGSTTIIAAYEGIESPPFMITVIEDPRKVVFVTSTHYHGSLEMGGLEGGDLICNNRARAAGLPGNFVAWLSTSLVDARDRVSLETYRYARNQINRDTLGHFDLGAAIVHGSGPFPRISNEHGNPNSTVTVWTGTRSDGTAHEATCNDWRITNILTTVEGLLGNNSGVQVDGFWTESSVQPCGALGSLYCFQQ